MSAEIFNAVTFKKAPFTDSEVEEIRKRRFAQGYVTSQEYYGNRGEIACYVNTKAEVLRGIGPRLNMIAIMNETTHYDNNLGGGQEHTAWESEWNETILDYYFGHSACNGPIGDPRPLSDLVSDSK